MKRILSILMMMSGANALFAADFNNISLQGQLISSAPIYGVNVHILSAGAVVGTASDISLIPDTTDFIFSTQTYISNQSVFRNGSDYVMRLSKDGITISSFSIAAVPFAMTMRGDAQTGNQNVFSAYGNVGIGTTTPSYRLHITSAAGTGGDMIVVSTGASNVIRMTGAGEVYASKFYGDGASLTGVIGAGDNLGNHTATNSLYMSGNSIYNANTLNANAGLLVGSGGGSQLFVLNGKVGIGTTEPRSAFEVAGLISIDTGTYSVVIGPGNGSPKTQRNIFIGYGAGTNSTREKNLFIGYYSGNVNSTGYENVFLGDYSGYGNSIGYYNSFTGSHSGMVNTTGLSNNFYGAYSGFSNTTGNENTFIGHEAGRDNTTGARNVFLGDTAGKSNTTGSGNILIGSVDVDAPSNSSRLNIGNLIYGDLAAKTVGISTRVPQAALDIVSTGTANTHFAQIWRDSNGAIKSSMSATGVIMAGKFVGDGSSLTGVIASGGVLKTGDTMTGQLTLSGSTLTVAGKDASGYSLSLSSGISMPAGTVTAGSFSGSGAVLTALNASSLASGTVADARLSSNVGLLNANQTVSGVKTFTSSVTIVGSAMISSTLTVQAIMPANFVGGFMYFVSQSSTCPAGWLKADGAYKSTADYSALYSMIGYMYGKSGNDFRLPDMTDGSFVRATGGNAAGQGTKQDDAFQGHKHRINTYAGAGGGGGAYQGGINSTSDGMVTIPLSDGSNGAPRTAMETRPKNYAMIPCIKY